MCKEGVTKSGLWRDWYQIMCPPCNKKEQVAAKKARDEDEMKLRMRDGKGRG